MNIDLSGKNALITGGTRGIGRVISKTLAACGARVGAMYRSDAVQAEKTVAELQAIRAADHFALQADISVESQATAATEEAVRRFGGALDIVVLDAAAWHYAPFTETSSEEWRRNLDVNLNGAFYVLKGLAGALRSPGSVVFISSGAAHDAMAGLTAYSASKAAINQLSAALAQEWGPRGIRVNVVSPGSTDKSDSDPNLHPENYTPDQRATADATALRRVGTAQDVANVVLFLASDLAGFVTGQAIRVNGGRV